MTRSLRCRILGHRWTKPFVLQSPFARVVSRFCGRCGGTSHTTQDVWREPVRELDRALDPTWSDEVRARARVREEGGAA